MPKQHIAIFKAMGLDQKDIDAIEALTEDQLKEWKPDTIVEAIRGGIKKVLENDPAFLDSIPEDKIPEKTKKGIEKSQYARYQNELVDTATKILGLEEKDLTDDDKKSIKKLTEKIAKTYLTKNSNDDGLKKMQAELSETKQALSKKDEEWQTKLTTETAGVKGGYHNKLIKTLFQSQLSSLDKIKLNVSPAYLVDQLLSKISGKGKVVLNENDELDFKSKDNEKLDVMTKDGKKVTFPMALRELVLEEKVGAEIKEGDDDDGGGKKKVIIDNGSGGGNGNDPDATVIPEYIKKSIDANIALEKKTE